MLLHSVFRCFQNLSSSVAVELFFQALQRHPDDIAVVQLRAEILLFGKAKPDPVQPVHIFGPKTRRVRSEIHKLRRPVRTDDFERERMPRFR